MSRRAKLLLALDREEAELRALLVPQLRDVAAAQSTGLFVTELNSPWHEVRPSAAGTEILTRAYRIIQAARSLEIDTGTLLAAKVIEVFEGANELRNEQRLGPIRLARDLLDDLGET